MTCASRCLTILAFLFSTCVFAQQALHIQPNKPLYISGESLDFFIHHPTGSKHEVVNLELMDEEGEILQRATIRSDGMVAAGSFSLPLSQKSGWCILRAYTIWMPSTVIKDLGYCIIPVYHAFDTHAPTGPIEIPSSPVSAVDIDFGLSKTRFQAGEQIEVELSPQQNQQLAMTVIEKPMFELGQFFASIIPDVPIKGLGNRPSGNVHQTKLLYLGKVNGSISQYLGGFYVAEEQKADWVSFSEDRAFGVELAPFVGTKYAQLLGMEPMGKIQLLEPEMFYASDFLKIPEFVLPDLPYPQQVIAYLEDSKKRRIIADLFAEPVAPLPSEDEERLSFGKADRTYSPKEYVQFNTVEDFIKEVGGLIRLRKNKAGYNIKLFLDKNVIADHPPLMFLNGYIVQDLNELIAMDLNLVDRIDVYRRQSTLLREFKTIGRNGVVAFYTKDPSIRPAKGNDLELQGFQKRATVWAPELEKGRPGFSPILYWHPGISSQASASHIFESTDDKGEYMIVVWSMDQQGVKRANTSIFLTSGS
ncbi:MAG: hypothetical protein AAF587_12720 [Bacteroidota bacterium]